MSWLSFVLGALERLEQMPEYAHSRSGLYATINDEPPFEGDETTQYNADQEVKKLLLALAVGNLLLKDLITPGANGTVIQSDGTNWIVTMPEFNNLVAKTLQANQVPFTVRLASGQSANGFEYKNAAGTVLLFVNSTGRFETISDVWTNNSANRLTSEGLTRIGGANHYIRNRNGEYQFGSAPGSNVNISITPDGSGIIVLWKSVGINTNTPTAFVDINSNTIRLRSNKTPTSTADATGNVGDICFDDNYLYRKTSTGWKRAALETF